VTALEVAANAIRFVGLVVTVAGLWFSAGGMRVVVSGRIDERRSSGKSLRFGLPLLIAGLILLFGGSWLANWAQLP
jgi:O-antigen/teichoic acid export membrane protein